MTSSKIKTFLKTALLMGFFISAFAQALRRMWSMGIYGSVDDVDFTLDLKLPLNKMPSRGQTVKFRDKTYKLSNVTYDSANASIKLHLQSISKG